MLHAAELTVMLSAAFKTAYLELVPQFERATGHKVAALWVPTVEMMRRLKGREVVDVVILSAPPIAELTEAGIIARGSAVNLATCEIGVAVKAGAPKPDLSSREALKRAVLA